MDMPWSPNRHCKSRVMPARDADGYLRILDPGLMPFPRDVLEVHEARIAQARRARRSVRVRPRARRAERLRDFRAAVEAAARLIWGQCSWGRVVFAIRGESRIRG